jgi:hypothetical protein
MSYPQEIPHYNDKIKVMHILMIIIVQLCFVRSVEMSGIKKKGSEIS